MAGLGLGVSLPARFARRSATATQVLRNLLFGSGQQGAFYVPRPTVDGQQVLYQDSAGTTPVTADGQPVGLMFDLRKNPQARRNLLAYSEQFDNGRWVKNRAVVVANDTMSPRGDITADKLVSEIGATNVGFAEQTYSFAATEYEYRIYAKAAELNEIQVYYVDSGGINTGSEAKVNLLDGSIITGNATVTANPNGWYEISVQAVSAGGSGRVRAVLTTNPADGTSGIYIWGAQLEQASTASDYQKIESGIGGEWTPGNHATQATAAAKPLYRTDGTLHWLQFDGVDDVLMLPQGLLSSLYLCGDFYETGMEVNPLIGDSSATNHVFTRDLNDYAVSVDGASNNTGGIAINGGAIVPDNLSGTNIIYEGLVNYPSGQTVLSVYHPAQVFYENIGKTGTYFAKMNLSGVVATRDDSRSEKASVESYLANLAGVTIP